MYRIIGSLGLVGRESVPVPNLSSVGVTSARPSSELGQWSTSLLRLCKIYNVTTQ